MPDHEMLVLLASAASLGLIHTVLGPDHYVPFVMMGKAGNWSLRKTCLITVFCGIGHVAGSVLLGIAGIGLGVALHKLELIESFRGSFAAWLFIALGLAYFAWGLKSAIRNKPHSHLHIHPDGVIHAHSHIHQNSHLHVHDLKAPFAENQIISLPSEQKQKKKMGVWILFTIFVFGPCEPLIPMLMYPAAKMSMAGVMAVALVFMFFTVATMTVLVAVSYAGIRSVRLAQAEKYMHAFAGLTLVLCGVGIVFLGL